MGKLIFSCLGLLLWLDLLLNSGCSGGLRNRILNSEFRIQNFQRVTTPESKNGTEESRVC